MKKRKEGKGSAALVVLILVIVMVLFVVLIKVVRNKNDISDAVLDEEFEEEVIPAEYIEILENGKFKNSSEQLNIEKKVDNLRVYNIRVTGDGANATLMFDIKNNSNVDQKEKDVTLVVKNKEENEIGRIAWNITQVEKHEVQTIEMTLNFRFINMYKIEIVDEPLI